MNASIKIKDVTDYLETWAPLALQEPYDNAGLLTGDAMSPLKGVLVTLDCTEAVLEEAIRLDCNLIVAHHPILFKGLKTITGKTYVERVVIGAIRHDIAIYAIHTNLDNVMTGVNRKICDKIGLTGQRILAPKKDTLGKLVTFVPVDCAERVLSALHAAGAGQIGRYKDCSFSVGGTGAFTATEGAQPRIGTTLKRERVDEIRIEVIFPLFLENSILSALRVSHPYEEVAYYVSTLHNENQEVGAGMIGHLDKPMEPLEFLRGLKVSMDLEMIRHTSIPGPAVQKVAVCGGSGSFLLKRAIQAGADVFITADFKYHDFFDADNKIIVADIGHHESEAFTKELIVDVLIKKFPTFAIIFSKTITNPISYI